MSTLNWLQNILVYSDDVTQTSNNPYKRSPDWGSQYYGITVDNPQGQTFTVAPNASLTLFDGSRTVNLSATSTYSITSTSASSYRLTYVSGGTPGFRTERTLNTSATTTFNVSVNNGALVTITYTSGTAPDFSSVQVGDTLYIASDSPFNTLNDGYFPILAKTSTSVSFQNAEAVAESNISLSTNYASVFKIFSSDNVQIGDTLVISSGFSTVTQGSYEITAVNSDFLDFTSSQLLPLESSVTVGSSGLTIYNSAKFFLYIEANQNCVLRLNGDSSDNIKIEPVTLDSGGISGVRGVFSKIGSCYRGVLVNKSPISSASVFLFTAERG